MQKALRKCTEHATGWAKALYCYFFSPFSKTEPALSCGVPVLKWAE